MKSLKRISKIQTKINTVLTQMISVGIVALIGLFLIEAPASGFTGSGSGTQADPYQITNATQLQEMQDDLNAHYVLAGDIDCSDTVNWNSGKGFVPIWPFAGTFDGQGHKITGLFINGPYIGYPFYAYHYVGLFGIVSSGTIKNVGLVNANILGYGGAVGGLVGHNSYGVITNSYATGSVQGVYYVGGLVGSNYGGDITNSYATGSVTGQADAIGGLVGMYYFGGAITNSYSTGSVTGGSYIGGLVGENDVGHPGGAITNSYWDTQTSGRSTSDGGTGKTTAEMMQQATFVDWDFVNIWAINEGVSYPFFDTTPPEIICPSDITVEQESGDGTVVEFECTATDNVDPNPIVICDPPSGSTFPPATMTVTCLATDASGNSSTCTFTVTVVDTTPPVISIIAPEPYVLYAVENLVPDFAATDSGSGVFDCWGTLTDSYGYSGDVDSGFTPEAGVYNLVVKAVDFAGNYTESEPVLFVVFDSDGGFVTGGGWIYSEPGAYAPDTTLEGKANFGFVSKYKKGATVPTGNTEFVFQAGDLNFHSSSYQWLVVTGSNYARFKGTGTINGSGDYKFMLWAGDNEPDTFRIKIWWEENDIENIVYDNGMNQPIEGGSIIVHTK
jgi:hypothetical protein